jgi:hypothetical protein
MLSYLYILDYSDGVNRDTQGNGASQPELPTGNGSAEIPEPTSKIEADRESGGSPDQRGLGLSANMRVYALAEKYEIHQLKEFAKSRFSKQAWDNWSSLEFLDVLGWVFDSTPSSDQGLRDVVTQVCSKNIRSLITNETFRNTITDIPCLGTSLLQRVSEETGATITGLREELAKASKKKGKMREERDKARALLDRAIELTNLDYCRFGCTGSRTFLKRSTSNSQDTIIMTCSGCGADHT